MMKREFAYFVRLKPLTPPPAIGEELQRRVRADLKKQARWRAWFKKRKR